MAHCQFDHVVACTQCDHVVIDASLLNALIVLEVEFLCLEIALV